jgi:hypothetical protein
MPEESADEMASGVWDSGDQQSDEAAEAVAEQLDAEMTVDEADD